MHKAFGLQSLIVFMEQQEKVGQARTIGYAIGIAAFVVFALWKLLV
jgi:hypothetical protein